MKIILASTSPRRKQLLELFGLTFDAVAPRFEEKSQSALSPDDEALTFAREKALSLAEDFPHALIIGSDTIVEIDGKKLGKPRDDEDAVAMLKNLSGRTHRVLTGLALWDGSKQTLREKLCVSSVTMKPCDENEILSYVATGEPRDKAGAYAVQGWGSRLIQHVAGNFFTVVGLPVKELYEFLQASHVQIPSSLTEIKAKGVGLSGPR